ncbi:Rpn family recombination-promoting nuclease/putative transposase, partial [Candidatus Fukatsuia symbiotica]|uniref:Rpn family recombination-promoting nuclease/putative transposase n=3 Tax=Candidatus Fukatsuia TaxID=1927833 RepID=UPI000E73BDEC
MKAIISPHDAFCKKFLGNLEVARDFLKTHLPPAILEKCDLSTLKVEDCSFVDENLRQYFSDIVYSMQMNDGSKAYIQCIIEHQSNPQLLMTFRELRYCVGIWQKYFDKNPNEKLPIVVPILFYHGKRRPYPYSRDLMDCFVDPELAREIYTKPFPLVDISVIPDEEIMTHGHVALMELVQKHIYMRDMINIVGPIAELLNKGYTNRELFHALLYYITYQGETKNTEKFFKALVDQTPTYREDIMT